MFGRSKKSLLECPSCGHKQEEAQFAQSTYCRGCWSYYKINDGVAVPSTPAPGFPFPTRDELARREASSPRPAPKPATTEEERAARRETQLELFAALSVRKRRPSSVQSKARIPLVATSSGDHPALARMARLLPAEPREGFRHVHCLDCDFPQSIPVTALSTMCLRCTETIPLEDYEIREMHHRRIRTRGNVHIHRKGGINGVAVQCNNLIIEGEFTGSGIDCDGDLTIARHGIITGPVRCRRLIVSGRANLTFTHPVQAREVIIDGVVKGDVMCEKKLHLEKKSLLEGDIQTRSLSVSEGARHSGMVSMPQLEERYAKFGDLSDIEGMELPAGISDPSPGEDPPTDAEAPASGDSGRKEPAPGESTSEETSAVARAV